MKDTTRGGGVDMCSISDFEACDGVPGIDRMSARSAGDDLVRDFASSGMRCARRECSDRSEAARLTNLVRYSERRLRMGVTVNQRGRWVYLTMSGDGDVNAVG